MSLIECSRTGADRPEASRRLFLSTAGKLAVVGGLAAVTACGNEDSPLADTPTPTPTPTGTPTPTPTSTPSVLDVTDTDLLVMTLQLTYLKAEFYSRAVLGVPLAASLTSGTQAVGEVTGPRLVTFADTLLAEQMREVAFDNIDHVTRLRAVLGGASVSRPAINLAVDDTGIFTVLARASGEVVAPATFDVYASQEQFLLGAFLLEDAVIAAYKGNMPIYQSSANIALCSGLMATAAHHTALVRSQLFTRGLATGSRLRAQSIRFSDIRDSYTPSVDDDQGVSGGTVAAPTTVANVTNADGEGVMYGRPPLLTLNTVYATRAEVEGGGFFPAGLTGRIRRSAAS